MGAKEAHKVLEICELLAWERPIYALQLAGWIAIAPMCGALVWRPHIHITGKHGSGKSTVMEKIVAPLVGPAALQFLGSGTSAAGIRQTLGSDARPVIHDEFDTGKISDKMVNDELELARSCSSETEAVVAKGGADGHAKTYRSRACFCWASIVTHADMAADLSRVSILTLVENGMDPDDKRARYDKLMEAIVHTFTKEFCCAFRARMVRLIPQIKKNAQTFARAGALCVGTQRAGDQMGGILAGAYALSRSDEISLEAAIEWINARDWSDYRISEDQQDEHRCLAKILQTIMKVQGDKGMADKNIGELVAIAASPMTVDGNISAETAEATLSRNGIRIVPEHNAFVISNTHTSIAKFLEKTPWVNNWAESLARLPNAMKAGTKRFAGAPPAKCVLLPLDLIHGDGT